MPLRLALLTLFCATSTFAAATRAVTTERGLFIESYAGEFARGPVRVTVDDPSVFWSRNLATGIFNSTSITDSLYCYTGSGQNAPREAAQYLVDGDGTPVLALEGLEWEVASQPDGPYWAAIDRDAANFNTLYFMRDDLPEPLWQYNLGYGYVGGTRCLQFSNDGSTLALFFGQLDQQPPYIFAWDVAAQDSNPLCAYLVEAGQGVSARAMSVSFDGALIAATADNFIHVVWRDSSTARDVVQIDASTDGLAMSADGNWLLTGFQAVRCRQWDGEHYVQRWSSGLNMRFCGQLLISPDTTYGVSCWYAQTYDRNYIRVHDLQTGQPLWSYQYRQGTGYQDLPIDADVSEDGNWFVVGSWGDQGEQNGEAVVFNRWVPEPYFELDLPGSCFSLDLSADGEFLIAAGKHVHANVFGNGGDAYVAWLDLPTTALPGADSLAGYDERICFCVDSVTIQIRVWNHGYAPATLDTLIIDIVPDDGGQFFDYWEDLGQSIPPGDTLLVSLGYTHCLMGFPINAGPYYLHWVLGTDTVTTEITSLDVQTCSGSDGHFVSPPSSYGLSAYPNPFNSTTNLEYSLPSAGAVDLRLFDISGRELETLTTELLPAGTHRISLNFIEYASGVYFAQLSSQFGVRTEKLLLLK